jgi:ribosomal protein S18 acetylase RimI-like enzyme
LTKPIAAPDEPGPLAGEQGVMHGINMNDLLIRKYKPTDEQKVIELWSECNLVFPWNNPKRDIERKLNDSPDLFFVGELDGEIVACCMSGYDGHRGWIYYLAVKPELQNQNIGSLMIKHAEKQLEILGCPKINLMVRIGNEGVFSFYQKIGYVDDPVVVLSKRLYEDDPYE